MMCRGSHGKPIGEKATVGTAEARPAKTNHVKAEAGTSGGKGGNVLVRKTRVITYVKLRMVRKKGQYRLLWILPPESFVAHG